MSKLTKKAVLAALLMVAALAVTGGAARAWDDDDDNDDGYRDGYGYQDPEIRQTVARLAYVSGDVSFARGDDPDNWQRADPNIPMTLGDHAWTAGGRLELQVHGGNLIRLAQSTDLTALNLTEDTKQFSLSAGVASFRIRRLSDDEIFEVDTPNGAITFERTGDYRIDVRQGGVTRVQVRRGRAIIASGGGQVPLGAGDAMLIEGYDPPRYDMIGIAAPDSWDRWVSNRDARYANVRSYDYVSADIAGVEDLDQYGRWQQVPNYGYCWTPASVAVGWQPYRAGRWIWQDPWGWTWVSSEPWGWAPYHYGRWVTWSSRWYWVPVAPRVAVATYSPALVAFVGGGPGFSVSVGIGTNYIGWFPLAPRDPLIPWWGRPTPAVNVNVTNITYVNQTYVTVVNQNTFVSSRSVSANYIRDKSIVNRIERAPVVRGTIPIAPTRESIRVTTRQATARRPPAAVASRTVVTRLAPPPAPPRFDNKVAVIRENKGRPVTTVEAERIVTREGRASVQPARASRPAAAESGRVTFAPKTEKAGAPKPEPLAPSRGRTLATKEQPVAPARETSTQRTRSSAPPRDTQADSAPKDKEQEGRDQAERAREAQGDQAQRERVQREQVERQQDRQPQREPADKQPAQREQADKQQAQREQAQQEQADRQKAQREQAEKQQAQREQAEKQQAQRAQAEKQQTQREQAQREQAEKQQTQREQAQRQQAQREQAEKQQAQREQAQRQQVQREQAEKQQAQSQQAQRQQVQREQAEKQQATRQQPQREPTARPVSDSPSQPAKAQPDDKDKEKPASSSDRGRGRPTPKPTPDK